VEEALFRGILFEEVRKRAGTAAAHFTSSALLAVLYGVEPGIFLYYFIVALALAYAYHKHGLVASVLVHSTHGFISLIIHILRLGL